MLSEEEEKTLITVIQRKLVSTDMPEPMRGEREPAYTNRVVQPIIEGVIKNIALRGLVVGGQGMAPSQVTNFLGLRFIPDCELSYLGKRILAIENKFIAKHQRQRQITSAIGQATIYSLTGFSVAIALIFDFSKASYPAFEQSLSLRNDAIRLIVKRRNHVGEFIS